MKAKEVAAQAKTKKKKKKKFDSHQDWVLRTAKEVLARYRKACSANRRPPPLSLLAALEMLKYDCMRLEEVARLDWVPVRSWTPVRRK